ncbi:helix-turn-helix domain-containing protein [Micromonospora krabiensis]|uniref:Helix-turn-helix domain-containing protein n=1 Tax=Micromonospora krabiensis TaxID=307121 RepID=A0A1C3MWR9_9ACTN|nr:helix-turn-helix transcriptional regulator [Micromonospora krabiensis]SBV24775.1 Helix-turn-helix domain-containing protein [Micromonospora krabiensis]
MAEYDEIETARHALGRRLAQLRMAAGHTQHSLARLIQYGRSSVANTETGHQYPDRAFWSRCDAALQTGGLLVGEYDRVAELYWRRRRAPLNQQPDDTLLPAVASKVKPSAWGADDDSALWEREETIAARRLVLKSSTDDDARLAYLEYELRQAVIDNERLTPAVLMARMRPLRAYVDQLMAGHQHPPQRARLYVAAAHLSGLLGALALDLGAFAVAHAYTAEAFDLADAAQEPDVQGWARATQSLVAFYAGRYHDALAFAQDGLRRAGDSPHRVRLMINGQARALARLGDRYGVDSAIDRAFTLVDEQPSDAQVSESLTFGSYCHARTAANAATAYLAIGRGTEVTEHLAVAITAFDRAGLAGPQALSRLDLATAHLHADDPDQAAALAMEALALTADQRYESVHQRARQFIANAKPFAHRPRLRQLAEMLAEPAAIGATRRSALPSPS